MAADRLDVIVSAVDKLTGPVGKMSQAMKGMGAQMKNVQASASTVSLFAVAQAASQLGAGISASFSDANQKFREFEHQIASLGAITAASEGDMASLQKEAFRLGSTTKFTAAQSAKAMETFARAGLKPKQIMDITSPALKLAIAENTDLDEASNVLLSTMKQMGVPMEDAAKTAGLLSAAAGAANVSLSTIKETMKEAGVAAGQLGLSQTEILSLTGVLGNLGLQGSKSGTGIKNFLNAMTDPAKIKKLSRLGIEIEKNADGSLNFKDTLKNVSVGLNKVESSADRMGIIKDIFGQVGQSAAAGLVSGLSDVEETMKKIDKPALSLDQKFKKLSQTSKALAEGTMSAKEAFQIALGQGFKPVGDSINKVKAAFFSMTAGFLQDSPAVSGAIMSIVGAGGFLIDSTQTLASVGTILTAVNTAGNLAMLKQIAMFPVMAGLKAALAVKTGVVTAAQWAWNVSQTANPIGLIIVAIAAVIGAITALVIYWDEVIAFFKETWGWLSSIFSSTGEGAKKLQANVSATDRQRTEINNKSTVDLNITTDKGAKVTQTKKSSNVNTSLGEQG